MPINKYLNNCLCCLSKVNSCLNLGKNPLANEFTTDKVNEAYPLELMVCTECWHTQLHYIVDPEILFKNYKYISGTTQTGLEYFKNNADFVNAHFDKPGNVLDIACNDGSQLNYFKKLGWDTYGVDPAENLHEVSTSQGHTVICDFWTPDSAMLVPNMDVILAQNVFAHTEHVDSFLQACKIVMKDSSILFIQTSQKNMIINSEFDTIYHEHISFFNTLSMKTLVERNGLFLVGIHEVSIHGTSYIFEIRLHEQTGSNVYDHICNERDKGMYSGQLYKQFELNAIKISKNLKETIEDYRSKGYKCIGFGASAKGQTVLCYSEIDLDYIIDENPLKIGLFSPKMNIPIVSFKHFSEDTSEKYLVVILAWNFADEIISKINSLNKNVVIIKNYFPKIVIV